MPMMIAISGLDSRKETVAETYAALLDHGVGFITVDSPGTGRAPGKVAPKSERMFFAVDGGRGSAGQANGANAGGDRCEG